MRHLGPAECSTVCAGPATGTLPQGVFSNTMEAQIRYVDASCSCLNVRLSVVASDSPRSGQAFAGTHTPTSTEVFAEGHRVSAENLNLKVVFPEFVRARATEHAGTRPPSCLKPVC